MGMGIITGILIYIAYIMTKIYICMRLGNDIFDDEDEDEEENNDENS